MSIFLNLLRQDASQPTMELFSCYLGCQKLQKADAQEVQVAQHVFSLTRLWMVALSIGREGGNTGLLVWGFAPHLLYSEKQQSARGSIAVQLSWFQQG